MTLVHIIDGVEIFYAKADRGRPEMWTAHPDRPGIYVLVGQLPLTNGSFNAEEAKKRARTAHLIAETLFDLDHWEVA